jgi:hypothetical protein
MNAFLRLLGKKKGFCLSGGQIASFLKAGIRPEPVPESYIRGDMIGGFMLIPTMEGDWIRQHARRIGSNWDGSFIPLIIYRDKTAAILVAHAETHLWEDLKKKVEDALGMPVYVRGD